MNSSSSSDDDEALLPQAQTNRQRTCDRMMDLSIECESERMGGESSSEESDTTTPTRQRSSTSSNCRQYRVAVSMFYQGRIEESLVLLERILCKNSDDVDALCLQGRCLMADTKQRAHALASFAAALSHDPDHTETLLYCARLHKEIGKYNTALEMIEKAYEKENMGESELKEAVSTMLSATLTDIATHEKLAGMDGWMEKYQRSVDVCPTYATAHYNLGVAASERGDTELACTCYRKAIELLPTYVEALSNLGGILQQQGDYAGAIDLYDRAYSVAPAMDTVCLNLAIALTHYGMKLRSDGKYKEGISLLEKALTVCPTSVEALYNMGVAMTENGEITRAMFMYHCAIRENPSCAEAHNNLGVLYRLQGRMELAMKSYEAALHASPNFPQALNNLAVIYTQQGKAQMALNLLRAALMTEPNYAEAWNNLGVLQRDVGDAEAARDSYHKCCDLEPKNRNAGQNLLLALNYIQDGSDALVCGAHRKWGLQFQELHPRMPAVEPMSRRDCSRKLRVGYVSPDLFIHSVSFFAEAPITNHDRNKFDVYVYSACSVPDAKTTRLRQHVEQRGHYWKDVSAISEKELASLIREDKIDILVDLTGHTANNKLATFAMKPAPVQVTWIGYPNSTGLEAIDYRLTDAVCDPVNTKQTYVENLIRLPACFLCYTPCPEAPSVSPLPALTNGYITFGSFNALAKQTPEVLQTWAKILKSIPESRLLLKNKPFACESIKERYWKIFEEHGIPRSRVDLLSLAATTESHLQQHSLIDICLDPWPYAGTTTTVEALYMGVPCLSLAGQCHAQNVGTSLLSAIGLQDDWVAHSVSEYIDKARKYASDPEKLETLRQSLRARVTSSPLCDVPKFMEGLENSFEDMWNAYSTSAR